MPKPKLLLLILFALIYLSSLYATLTSVGLTWDEVEYFRYGSKYIQWFSEPKKIDNIDKYWSINHEHPPLVKLLGGFSHLILHEKLGIANNIFAYRFFIPILGLILFLAVFYFTFDLTKNFWSGLFASLAFFSMPRLFGQAHFLAYDFPVTVFIFLTAYATFKSLRSWKWGLVAAIFWGLALLTKFNAFLGILPILLYIMVAVLPDVSVVRDDDDVQLKFSKVPVVVFLFFCFFVFLFIFWPWMWNETLSRLLGYFGFHINHSYMPSFYLGKTFIFPTAPWHYVWVMMVTTVPVTTLVLSVIGSVRILKRKESVLILASILFPLLLMSLPSTPKYNGERLFLQIFPFIAVLTGLGFGQLMEVINFCRGFYRPSARSLRSLAQGSRMTELTKGLCFCVFVFLCFCDLYKSHPYYLSYYNFLADKYNLVLETDYWGHSQIGVLDFLNKNLEQNAVIDVAFLRESFQWYQKDGLLRQDIKIKDDNKEEPHYLVIFQCESWFGDKDKETSWWRFIETHEPVFTLKNNEVTLARVYRVE